MSGEPRVGHELGGEGVAQPGEEPMSVEPMHELATELLALERVKPVEPSVEATERLLHRLEATLGLPPLVTPSAPATSPSGPAAPAVPTAPGVPGNAAPLLAAAGGSKLATGLAMLVAGAVMGSAATAVLYETRTPPVIQTPSTSPEGSATQTATPTPTPTQTPKPTSPEPHHSPGEPPSPAPPPPPAAPPRKPSTPPPSKLVAEQPLLDIARAAIMSGRSKAALDALARHTRDFPNGELAEEREALHVQALAQAGDATGAAARAANFRKRFPRSIFLPSVDAAAPPP